MADYCLVYGVIHFTSPAGWLPVHRDQLRAQRSVTSMGKLYVYLTLQQRTFSVGLRADGTSTTARSIETTTLWRYTNTFIRGLQQLLLLLLLLYNAICVLWIIVVVRLTESTTAKTSTQLRRWTMHDQLSVVVVVCYAMLSLPLLLLLLKASIYMCTINLAGLLVAAAASRVSCCAKRLLQYNTIKASITRAWSAWGPHLTAASILPRRHGSNFPPPLPRRLRSRSRPFFSIPCLPLSYAYFLQCVLILLNYLKLLYTKSCRYLWLRALFTWYLNRVDAVHI